ncbi:MAG TPA: FecR domain-containing protein [Sphingobacterium sp.]|nr:FecR domain-containing protein [Sphingobacterium sp.]
MNKIPKDIIRILSSASLSDLNEEDNNRLQCWLAEDIYNQRVYDELQDKNKLLQELHLLEEFDVDEAWRKQANRLRKHHDRNTVINWKLWVSAIAAILLIVGSLFFIRTDRISLQDKPIAAIQPGGNQATIVLSDGRTIVLKEDASGVVIDSTLRYEDEDALIDDVSSTWNAFDIYTPKGGQYRMTLPDGSKVWLNTASKLRYEESTTERKVVLEGEAYFEIEKRTYQDRFGVQQHKPFHVFAGNQSVRVMGTHFNVKAYPEDIFTQTTLVEGAVVVEANAQKIQLRPGEQAASDNKILSKIDVDSYAITAWKDGNFVFVAERLEEILRQVGRWYNVDFEMESESLNNERFEAMLPRFSQLEEFLMLLERTEKVKFKYKGRTIYVLKNNK